MGWAIVTATLVEREDRSAMQCECCKSELTLVMEQDTPHSQRQHYECRQCGATLIHNQLHIDSPPFSLDPFSNYKKAQNTTLRIHDQDNFQLRIPEH